MSNTWDRVVNAAACTTLSQLGGALVNAGAWTAVTGVGAKPAVAAIGVGSLSNLAAAALCPETELPVPSTPNDGQGCWKVSAGGYALIEIRQGTNVPWVVFSTISPWNDATEILSVEIQGPLSDGRYRSRMVFQRRGGGTSEATSVYYDTPNEAARVAWRLDPQEGYCSGGGDEPEDLPDGYDNPVVVTDPETNCTYNVSLQGFMRSSPDQLARPVYIVESTNQQRTDGGRLVGACNFEPTIVIGGGGDGGNQPPYPPIPVPSPQPPDIDGEPWWLPLVRGAIAGVVAGATEEALEQLLDQPLPATSLSINAACEYKEDGSPEEFTINFPEQKYQDRVLDALTAQVEFAQQFHLWKTPICGNNTKPVLFLHWRSITFESDEYTDTGNSRLVKRFRYRGSAPGDVVELANHWKDFEWDTGDVIVYHKGTGVGTPKVWAASEAEGKRVIRHAFAEAGVDPDQSGEWGVSGTDHARYGVARRVKLKRIDGAWSATARQGASGWPEAACIAPDS